MMVVGEVIADLRSTFVESGTPINQKQVIDAALKEFIGLISLLYRR